ncbi:hypothetical protein [Demequina sp. NBRC 110053]|uniref:hypothetical protein n=1 Tax=Demequina sp. NBRC 110053 TaxID=1570342 RepID=UPI001184F4BA|nr:hypothetical protein [Demequina sp. NBRC 110053]
MSAELVVALLAALMSAGSVVVVAVMSMRARDRDRVVEAREVERLVREPLAYAAGDLQSRCWTIATGRSLAVVRSQEKRETEYFERNTSYLVGQYFAWIEVLRRRAMLVGGTTSAYPDLMQGINAVMDSFSDPANGTEFQVFPGEQRAIGELCLTSIDAGANATIGYAEFCHRIETDPEFSRWFDTIALATESALRGEIPARAAVIQNALIDLIEIIDRDGKYTPFGSRERVRPELTNAPDPQSDRPSVAPS